MTATPGRREVRASVGDDPLAGLERLHGGRRHRSFTRRSVSATATRFWRPARSSSSTSTPSQIESADADP
ncbi:hypothetical protein, partial [Halogeometricum sp. CBA1124]|uniref:hypothetical protein n=1 Tax=Halogeometricum sp. CBA1124 TaxID=2668071 RepID=UPI00142C0F85